jgi:hypothetical protein
MYIRHWMSTSAEGKARLLVLPLSISTSGTSDILITQIKKWRFRYLPERNDEWLNKHNTVQLQAWRANVDMQPVLGIAPVLLYIAKYISKPEDASSNCRDYVKDLMKDLPPEEGPKRLIQKLLIRSIGERDISAQETSHLLQNLPLRIASREWVTINTFPDVSNVIDNQEDVEYDGNLLTANFWDKYCSRSLNLSDISAYEIAQKYRWYSGGWHARRKEYIVQVIPFFKKIPQEGSKQFSTFAQSELRLFKPFRTLDDLSAEFKSMDAAYLAFKRNGYTRRHVLDTPEIETGEIQTQPQQSNSLSGDVSELEGLNEVDTKRQDRLEWQYVTEAHCDMPIDLIEHDLLGKRIKDLSYQWSSFGGHTDSLNEMRDWIEITRKKHTEDFRKAPVVKLESLETRQRAVCSLVSFCLLM